MIGQNLILIFIPSGTAAHGRRMQFDAPDLPIIVQLEDGLTITGDLYVLTVRIVKAKERIILVDGFALPLISICHCHRALGSGFTHLVHAVVAGIAIPLGVLEVVLHDVFAGTRRPHGFDDQVIFRHSFNRLVFIVVRPVAIPVPAGKGIAWFGRGNAISIGTLT